MGAFDFLFKSREERMAEHRRKLQKKKKSAKKKKKVVKKKASPGLGGTIEAVKERKKRLGEI